MDIIQVITDELKVEKWQVEACLLYTSDAADEL